MPEPPARTIPFIFKIFELCLVMGLWFYSAGVVGRAQMACGICDKFKKEDRQKGLRLLSGGVDHQGLAAWWISTYPPAPPRGTWTCRSWPSVFIRTAAFHCEGLQAQSPLDFVREHSRYAGYLAGKSTPEKYMSTSSRSQSVSPPPLSVPFLPYQQSSKPYSSS